MQKTLSISMCVLLAGTTQAADLNVSVEVPKLSVAEYHRPYVAMWIERLDRTVAAHIDVWYDTKLKDNEGTKWLKDMRLWWRRAGRELKLPADGISGATRAPGTHQLTFKGNQAPLVQLAPGEYRLMVEAAREVGGREVVEVPFTWPAKQPQTAHAKGQHELGVVTLTVKP